MNDIENDETWSPPPENVGRDALVSVLVLVLLYAGAWLYAADDPRAVLIHWLIALIAVLCVALAAVRIWGLIAASISGAVQATTVSTVAPPGAETDTLSAMKPADLFGLWANASLRLVPDGVVIANDAYQHYARACAINGVQAMSSNQFGTLLTRRAEASAGVITKTKSNGRMAYRGWGLDGEADRPARAVAA